MQHLDRFPKLLCLLAVTLMLAACAPGPESAPAAPTRTSIDPATLTVVSGQRLYVPAYSQIYYEDSQRTWDFAVTLTIHNTDEEEAIVVRSVRYDNSNGELVRDYVTTPFLLPPLATHAFTVSRDDNEGGVGANFVVDWVAESDVSPPVVQAVMISTAGQQGLSLITDGVVIRDLAGPK